MYMLQQVHSFRQNCLTKIFILQDFLIPLNFFSMLKQLNRLVPGRIFLSSVEEILPWMLRALLGGSLLRMELYKLFTGVLCRICLPIRGRSKRFLKKESVFLNLFLLFQWR